MTAEEAKELAEKLNKLSAYEIGIALIELDYQAWKRGWEEAYKKIEIFLKRSVK